ncbi:MAG: hypothetical protein JW797_11050 [Bradymonadales bacterium]|nr:hypothetical protein [Bradymonadales bacterium]
MNTPVPASPPSILSTPIRLVLGLFLLALLAIMAATFRQGATLTREAQPRLAYREGYLLPSSTTLKALGLGHDELMADLVWLKALAYFASHFYLDRDFRWLDRYIETMVELDPDFRMVYHWAGVVTMYGGQRIDNQAVQNSIRFLEQGRQRYPDDWLFNFMLGVNYRYELTPTSEEEARQWRLMGATYLSRAAQLPGAPPWLVLNASRNLEEYGATQEGIALDRQYFLTHRGALSATLAAEMQLHRLFPTYLQDPRLGQNLLVASGQRLKQRLDGLEWARLFAYRRLLYADLDSPSGYLEPFLATLARGEPFLRVGRIDRTPVDPIFYPTVEAWMEHHDRQ